MFFLERIGTEIAYKTREVWEQQIAAHAGSILPSQYERILDWADKYAGGGGDADTYVYALIADKQSYATAYLEMSHAVPRAPESWLKVLSIHMEPRLDLDVLDTLGWEELKDVRDVLRYALTESLRLTFDEHPSASLKVYGRNEYATGFFDSVVAEVEGTDGLPGIDISVQGRWLIFQKNAKSE